jgi:DNA-binding SARP family transcriptional activator
MQVTLLGPVEVHAGGRPLPLGGLQQRCGFALLALNVNRTVSLDRLVYEIWSDEPPAQAALALQAYVSRLRKVFAAVPDARPAGSTLVTATRDEPAASSLRGPALTRWPRLTIITSSALWATSASR